MGAVRARLLEDESAFDPESRPALGILRRSAQQERRAGLELLRHSERAGEYKSRRLHPERADSPDLEEFGGRVVEAQLHQLRSPRRYCVGHFRRWENQPAWRLRHRL